jgi:hypothetical protein
LGGDQKKSLFGQPEEAVLEPYCWFFFIAFMTARI